MSITGQHQGNYRVGAGLLWELAAEQREADTGRVRFIAWRLRTRRWNDLRGPSAATPVGQLPADPTVAVFLTENGYGGVTWGQACDLLDLDVDEYAIGPSTPLSELGYTIASAVERLVEVRTA